MNAIRRVALIVLVWELMMSALPADGAAVYTIDIGGPMDELFIGPGWYGIEGPYPQYGGIWQSKCRWASQGATVRVPVSPGVTNNVEIRCGLSPETEQHLRVSVDGKPIAEFEPRDDMQYGFELSTDAVGDKRWVELKLETDVPGPRSSGDSRDLRTAVDWVKVSAEAPARGFVAEALAAKGVECRSAVTDAAPTIWRYRYDPNNVGDTYGIQNFGEITYDDSAFEVVPTEYMRDMRRGDAAWYRAWINIENKPEQVRKSLRLPGEKFEKDGSRKVWVNGVPVAASKAADSLGIGSNVIVVKVMKGPLPHPTGDSLVDPPTYTGRWSPERVVLKPGVIALRPEYAGAKSVTVTLEGLGGKRIGREVGEVVDLGEGRRGFEPKGMWALSEYGEYSFVVEDDAGHRQSFPVHFLGIHFFHWGWYSAGGGTNWNGFEPCSNDYLDELLSRIGDWDRPHHSICWGGAILAPGTGFRRTEKVDYIGKFREAIASGRLGFVGMPFPPRNICTDFGESLLRSMRRSLALYESQLGVRPTRFYSHDATLTPLLPEIMRLCGYDTYCIAENWWGQGRSIPNSRDCEWRAPDGSEVRVLDSWYHGISPVAAAHRAVEQGKPAVLCNEEFACLDRTVFLNESDLTGLAAEGIFVQPVSLEEYQRITERFADEYTYEGDDALCYKGWTGGGEGEVEYEKANRLLETRLVALENVAAFARWLGIEVDQKPIDEQWDKSMRAHECHLHWGNGYPDTTKSLWEGVSWADGDMKRVAGLIAAKVRGSGEGVTVFNPLGFERGGLVEIEAPAGARAIAANGRAYPLQADADRKGRYLVAVPDLPSCGYRRYKFLDTAPEMGTVTAQVEANAFVLSNGVIDVSIDGSGGVSISDGGRGVLSGADELYVAVPQDKAPDEPLSVESNPLNLKHYVRAVAVGEPKVVCSGPVMCAVENEMRVSEYPGVAIVRRVSLVKGERQARVRLTMKFDAPTVLCPAGAPGPHEGTYFPGMFVRFAMPADAKPLADMAYCTTDGVLTSTNHETFVKQPFRNGTFNTLSLAGPNSGEFFVLTRGLPDFFVIRRPESYLGMSLGVGPSSCSYEGEYVHEYALYVPERSKRGIANALSWKAAQSFLVGLVSTAAPGGGSLPEEQSFASVSGESVVIPGIQMENGKLSMRVVNLSSRSTSARVSCLAGLDGAEVAPAGAVVKGVLELPPRAVREIRSE